jgi:gibberellin A4 carboxyl methyltransferase
VPAKTAMMGEGFYDANSGPQRAVIVALLPWLEEAVLQMDLLANGGPIVVADFGCSEGRNSIAATRPVVAALRARDSRAIQTIHSDLPVNNFNQLFANLCPAGQPAFAFPDVFSAAVAGSMYEQLLPAKTVAVATTFNAIGWLDRLPDVAIPDYILPMGPGRPRPGVRVSPEARQAVAAQAKADLRRFYSARAAEMVPGGKLLVASFGSGDGARTCDGLYDVLNDALLDLVDAGRFGRASYEQLVFPLYFRTEAELVEPFADEGNGPGESFRPDRAMTMEVPVPFVERLGHDGDVSAYARDYTGFMRAFTEPVIRSSLAGHRDPGATLNELYARVEARLAEDPSGYAFRYVQVAALLTRL